MVLVTGFSHHIHSFCDNRHLPVQTCKEVSAKSNKPLDTDKCVYCQMHHNSDLHLPRPKDKEDILFVLSDQVDFAVERGGTSSKK